MTGSHTYVEVTVRVVPLDTRKPVTEQTTTLLFEEQPEAQRRDIVSNAARALYPRAANVRIPTPPQEGGR